LRPHPKPRELKQEAILLRAGEPSSKSTSPTAGSSRWWSSCQKVLAIEVAMIGRDSIHGATSAMDGQVSLNTAIVQLPGTCETLEVTHFRKAADQSLPLRTVLLRHEQVLFAQAQQSAACNVSHHIDPGCHVGCCGRLSGSDRMEFTQEFLAEMLGVRRSSVSPVAGALQKGRPHQLCPRGTSRSSLSRVFRKHRAIATER
jgi:hypothetical protein